MTVQRPRKASLNVCVWNALSKLDFIKNEERHLSIGLFYFQITQLNVPFRSGYSTLKKKEISTL